MMSLGCKLDNQDQSYEWLHSLVTAGCLVQSGRMFPAQLQGAICTTWWPERAVSTVGWGGCHSVYILSGSQPIPSMELS